MWVIVTRGLFLTFLVTPRKKKIKKIQVRCDRIPRILQRAIKISKFKLLSLSLSLWKSLPLLINLSLSPNHLFTLQSSVELSHVRHTFPASR